MENKTPSKYDYLMIFGIIAGILLTAMGFTFHFVFKIEWLNYLLAVTCFANAWFTLVCGARSDESITKKQVVIYPLLILGGFCVVVAIVLTIINPFGSFCVDYILWTLYASASIVPIIFLVMLCVAGLSYA